MKRKIQSLVIVGLLLVIAIACQHDNDLDTQIASKTEIHEKVSINEAKVLFEEEEAIKVKQKLANKNGYFLKINPDWNSFQQDRDFGNGNYSKVTTTLFGTDIKGEILFIKQNDSIKQFLFMTRTDSINTQGEVLDAQLYFFETNGKLVEAYKIENQRITKRLKIHKQRSLTARRGGEECGFLQKVDVLGWDVGCTSGNNDNWGSGKKNTWGPNPFTFDGVNELYGVTVEHWHSSNNYTFSHQMNFRNFRLMGNNAGSSFSEAGAHIIRTNPPKPREIIDNLTNPCAKRILNQMRSDTGRINIANLMTPEIKRKHNFSQMIIDLFEKSSQTHLTFTNGTTKNGANGSTSGTTITLNNNYLQTATQLAIARTIIHEMVHAYLNVNLRRGTSDVKDQKFSEMLINYFNTNYRGMNTGRAHHEFMGQYIEAMAISLQQWDMRYGTGTDLGFEYYKALSYGGLFQTDVNGAITTETNSFKELVPNAKDRQDIANKILNEQNNSRNAKGAKCK